VGNSARCGLHRAAILFVGRIASKSFKRKTTWEGISMKSYAFVIALLALTATPSLADNMSMPVNADGVKWGPAPPNIPKGAQIAVLSGDPSKDGLYVLRLKMPANYKIPAHNHPTSEYLTVISGTFHIGMGDKLDQNKGVELRAGGFGEAPAHMNHYAWTSEETVVQVHGQGPATITYVNPADDPSN
jgi:mannose-6-phosphate isomerase-like protein (cupin superfamily)